MRALLNTLILQSLYGLARGIGSLQTPIHILSDGVNAFSEYDTGLFTPLGHLDALTSSEFTQLEHPAFQRHSVRIKESQFCDGSVR